MSRLTSLWALRLVTFWPVWSTLTAGVLAFAAWHFRKTAPCQKPMRQQQFVWSPGSVASLLLLAVYLGGFAAMTLFWEDFSGYDDSQFTEHTLRGKNFPLQIYPAAGRFFPLALQEFSWIGRFAKSAVGYQIFLIGEVFLLAAGILFLVELAPVAHGVLLTVFALTIPSVVVSMSGLVLPERNLLLVLVCFALCIQRFEQTHSPGWAVGVVGCCQVMVYLKEPVFLLLLGFAAARILLRGRRAGGVGWGRESLRSPESRLDLCIAAVAASFLCYYCVIMFPHFHSGYLTGRRTSPWETFWFYLKKDVLAWILVGVSLYRTIGILRRAVAPSLLWDGLACGGVLYLIAYIVIGLAGAQYLAPVDLIAALYLGRLMYNAWGDLSKRRRIAVAATVTILFIVQLERSAAIVLERKYGLRRKAIVAGEILERYKRHPELVRDLYFPYAEPFVLMEFASYLSYRGLPVERLDARGTRSGDVRISGGKAEKTGPCFMGGELICHPSRGEPNAMIVVLPDDRVPPSDLKRYEEWAAQWKPDDPGTRQMLGVLRMLWSSGRR